MLTARNHTAMKSLKTIIILSSVLLLTSGIYKSDRENRTTSKNPVATVNLPSVNKMITKENTNTPDTRITEVSAPAIKTSEDFSYLKFDVDQYAGNEAPETMELPEPSNYDYLKFDVSKFIEENTDDMEELPSAGFDYLKFDVNNFTEESTAGYDEMPAPEFDYLKFNVNAFVKLSSDTAAFELPEAE